VNNANQHWLPRNPGVLPWVVKPMGIDRMPMLAVRPSRREEESRAPIKYPCP
jgi:hypothetical protein